VPPKDGRLGYDPQRFCNSPAELPGHAVRSSKKRSNKSWAAFLAIGTCIVQEADDFEVGFLPSKLLQINSHINARYGDRATPLAPLKAHSGRETV
jgi:hypothetical protein